MTAKRGTSADAEAPCIFSTLYNRDWAPYATVAAPGLETSWLTHRPAGSPEVALSVRYAPGCPRLQPASASQPRGLRWPAHRPRFRHGCTLHEESDVHADHVRLVRLAQARHRTSDQGRPSTDAQSPSAVARDDDAVRGDQSSKRRCRLATWRLLSESTAKRHGPLPR